MIQLRPYQEKIITETQKLFASGKKRILVTAPTGAGKTVVFSEIARKVAEKGNKVLILTNRIELLNQAGGSIEKVGLRTFSIEAGTKYVNKNLNVYVAMSQTLKNRLDQDYWVDFLKTIDLIIIDECHLQDFNYIFDAQIFEKIRILGFTATPKRSGKQVQLGLQYEEIVETITLDELIKMGYLVNCDYYGCSMPDLSNVGYDRMKGDYKEGEMFRAYNQSKLYAGVVRNWKQICPNTKTLVFCCNIQHAIKTCQEFNDNGITAKFIVSGVAKPKYPKKVNDGTLAAYEEKKAGYEAYCEAYLKYSGKREDLIEKFQKNEFFVLINAAILTTGFDCPSIETVIINRATMSTALWLQMLGRGSRIFEGKTHFNILDFGDNQARLGTYNEDRNWALWHEESKGGGVAPIKRCGLDSKDKAIYGENHPKRSDANNKDVLDGCGRYIHAGLTICPFCGFKYPAKDLKDVDLENIFFDQNEMEFKRVKPVSQMNDIEITEYCEAKGHNRAWLWRQIFMRGGMDRIDLQNWSAKEKESAKKYCRRF